MIPFVENELNISHFILEGYVELQKFRYLYFVIMFSVYSFVVFFNAAIVYLVCTQKSLHEPMYIFIACLLLNAMMVITAIYPKVLVDVLSHERIISYSGCLIQAFIVYSFGCAEFSLLSAMAYDRYVSICKPLQYHTLLGIKTVKRMLLFCWLWPAFQILILVLLIARRAMNVKVCEFIIYSFFCDAVSLGKVNCGYAAVSIMYGMYLMVSVIFLPFIFIFFTYIRILIVCLQRSKDFRKKAIKTCLPHLLVIVNHSLLAVFDIVKYDMFNDQTVRFIMTILLVIYPYLFNPIIYGLKMKEISKRLKQLFCQFSQLKVTNS